MDPAATPWRVLEDGGSRSDASPTQPQARSAYPPSIWLMAAGAVALALVAFFLAFGTGTGGAVLVEGAVAFDDASTDPNLAGASAEPELIVEVVGAVVRPGVFHVPAGARVGDLVEAAGGYSARVDTARASRELNLAARLNDGDQVRVPSRDDPADRPDGSAGGSAGSSSGGGPLDLNRATSAELESLPGIGPVTANKILSAREETSFVSVEDLRTRKLVGEKTFEKLKDLVTVR